MESCGRAGLQQAAGSGGGGGGCWVLVEARLHGGAPWGFTVQGGLEHNEPLIISKVEEGGKVDSLDQPLQVGDEIIIINDVELTGYRQEAIALVKGSYKTLQLTVRRELDPGFIEEFGTSGSSVPALPPPAAQDQHSPVSSHQSTPSAAGGVQLRIKNRRNDPASRPHSWHSTKLGEGQQEVDPDSMGTVSSGWSHSYHASASTTDLSSGFDSGTYLRKSPDQYSSRGSMESLDHPPDSSQHQSGAQHQHSLGHYSQTGSHPTYSSCHQLSSSRSSNSIDHLHSKRDSAYSSFSTSSSIPEYLASTPTFSPERSYSLEAMSQRGGSGEMQQADIHYVRTVYDNQQRLLQEHGLGSNSAAHLHNTDSRGRGPASGLSRDLQAGGVCYRGNGSGSSSGGGVPASNRHSVGPIWGPAVSCSSYENLKAAPAPPRRSDSYAALRNHDRPNSWSSLEHARSLRSLQKGSWHHSSGPVALGIAKGSYGPEGQLHTVIEKSPESSPTTKPRQGGGFSQPHSPTGPSPIPPDPTHQTGNVILPTGKYPLPQPEPHYPQVPNSSCAPGSSGVYLVLDKESRQQHGLQSSGGRKEGDREEMDGRMPVTENGYQHFSSSNSALAFVPPQLRAQTHKPDRAMEQSSSHSDPLRSSMWTQVADLTSQSSINPLLQALPTSTTQPHPPRVPGDQTAPQYQQWEKDLDPDREHPLTRLELALVEVQRCSSSEIDFPVRIHDSGGSTESGHGPTRSLSVLEKVSCFERRERAGKQCSHSTCTTQNNVTHLRATEKGRSITGAEDLRNMLERSTSGAKAHRTMSYRGGSSDHMKYRTPADPILALQRSRSSLQLKEPTEADGSKDFSWSEGIQEMLGYNQGTIVNRSYRDSVKDAQSKVLRSTSFRRRDLNSSANPPMALPHISSSNHHLSSVPGKHQFQDKKGPKTLPKPQCVFIPSQATLSIASPHTPKERHVVSPEVRGPSPPALPSIPPVGLPLRTRICGRKRLAADQKKRSYSEPEKMNEIGVSDPETAALYRRGGENSVADRRKMFELAASRSTNGILQSAQSRPDLRQVQQDALAEYVVRKRGAKNDEGSQRSGSRPRSAYLPLENSNLRTSHSLSDTMSISSASSLHSLQEPMADGSVFSGESRHTFNLPPGADLRSFQSNLFYPGTVTSPRPPAHSQPSTSFGPPPNLQDKLYHGLNPESELNKQSHSSSGDPVQGDQQPSSEAQQKLGLSKKLNKVLQRAQSIRDSRRSASTEDLLERSEESQVTPQHHRSLSSPTEGRLNQGFPPADVRLFGLLLSETGRRSFAENRLADMHASGDQVSQQHSQNNMNVIQPERHLQDAGSGNTPVSSRERQRKTSEWQRGTGASTLAASVGLQCPLTPSGIRDGDSADWHAGERLSQANLDAIVFPGILQTGSAAAGPSEPLDRPTIQSLSDATIYEDMKNLFRLRGFCLEMTGGPLKHQDVNRSLSETSTLACQPTPPAPATPPSSHPTLHQKLPSLRISESSLSSSTDQQHLETGESQEEEVFLQHPSCPPPTESPVKGASSVEYFPPPPDLDREAENQAGGRTSPLPSPPISPSVFDHSPPGPSLPSPVELQPPSVISEPTPATRKDNLTLEYQPLPRREKTYEELRVEVLTKQLVLQDGSLAPLLDVFGVKSTVELMEEVFTPNSRLGDISLWKHSGSRIQVGVSDPSQRTATDRQKEPDQHEDDKDLNNKKVELCEALRCSVEALQQEREALREEQRHHRALGTSLETLVQEQLKANEKDKYSMFIGDLEKIVNLLLSLCSRLMRIDRSLLALERDELAQEDAAEERDSLLHKRSMVLRQTDDAQELKENLERRQRVVHSILAGYLTEPQLQDYRSFVSTKPSLLIRQRHLDNLIRQGEEQLTRLADSLPQELAEARGGRPFSSPSPAPCPLSPSAIPGSAHPGRSTAVTSL